MAAAKKTKLEDVAERAEKLVEAADVKSDILDVVEDTGNSGEDTVTLIEQRATWLRNPKTLLILVGVGCAVTGGALTYLFVSKRLAAKYQRQADEQVESVKETYALLRKEGPENDLEKLAERYKSDSDEVVVGVEVVPEVSSTHKTRYDKISPSAEAQAAAEEEVATAPVVRVTPPPEPINRNIFDTTDPTSYFNWGEEMKHRADYPDGPWIITVDEFDSNDSGFDQEQYTFYEKDGVLVDNTDQPVADLEGLVGSEQLTRFGHASKDPNIVHVRNVIRSVDMEIARSTGSYSEEVLGYRDETELQHSANRDRAAFRRRFRDD